MSERNAMRWAGEAGHYEVWYVSLTDRGSGLGAWVRLDDACAGLGAAGVLDLVHGDEPGRSTYARKSTLPITELQRRGDPFRLVVGDCELSDRGFAGAGRGRELGAALGAGERAGDIVHPLLERATHRADDDASCRTPTSRSRAPSASAASRSNCPARAAGRRTSGAPSTPRAGAGLTPATSRTLDGAPRRGDWIEAVSVVTPRLGRDVGPSTPVAGVLLGEPF